jgi:hypothetical protein
MLEIIMRQPSRLNHYDKESKFMVHPEATLAIEEAEFLDNQGS